MGTRLYPCTNDVSKLEKFAGVKPGTDRLLKMYKEAERLYTEAYESDPDQQDIGYDFHCMQSDDLEKYNSFLLFGFGKFNLSAIDDRYCVGNKVSGKTTHTKTALRLLETTSWFRFFEGGPGLLQEILDEAEGFCWG